MKFRAFAISAVMLVATLPVQAQSAAEVLREAGIEGTWSVNCSVPPGDRNGHHTYIYEGGGVREARDFGNSRDSSDVIRARIFDDGTLEIVTRNPQFTWRVVYRRLGDGKIRAITSGEEGGTNRLTIQNGRFLHNGNETQALVRCN